MRIKVATFIAALVCASGVFGAFSIMSPIAAAISIKPALCEYECGGSWGAREHAKAFAEDEEHGLFDVYLKYNGQTGIKGCELNSQYGAQWDCWGAGYSAGYSIWDFHVWMGEYGKEKHWVWETG
jgi:hypothetical protein